MAHSQQQASFATLSYTGGTAAIRANVEADDKTPTIIIGPPGCGKTTLPLTIAVEYGIPRDVAEKCIFRPSLRDPVDLAGLPHNERDPESGQLFTHWAANSFIKYVNDVAAKYGIAFLIIDELMQAVPMMQNALAGLMLDRFVGENFLDDRVFIVATGNRVEDKAGAGRLLTQVANRAEIWELSVDLESWGAYMTGQGYDPMLVAYARFDPACLNDFDPNRSVNGTMRSMEAAAKISTDLPEDVYLAKLSGRIPQARAAQYVAFRKLFDLLPTAEQMINNPTQAKLPTDNRGAMYAASALAFKRADRKTFGALTKYVERIALDGYAPDIEAAFYKDVACAKTELCETAEFVAWATGRGEDVVLV